MQVASPIVYSNSVVCASESAILLTDKTGAYAPNCEPSSAAGLPIPDEKARQRVQTLVDYYEKPEDQRKALQWDTNEVGFWEICKCRRKLLC